MQLPNLSTLNDNITMLSQFLGVNKSSKIQDSEFSDMSNITNDYFPSIGNRPKRAILRTLTNPQGIFGGKYLSYVDDDKLYYNENYLCDLNASCAGKERQLVMMGAYLCVFPDGLIYNTYTDEIDHIENKITSTTNPTFTLCRLDGTNYTSDNCVTGSTEPTDKTKYWLDTSSSTVVLKMYSSSSSSWVSVGTTYVKIAATGIGKGFASYDAADISGVDTASEQPAIYNNWDFNTSNIIYDCGDDFIVVAGLINLTFTNSKPVTVYRKMPEMDFVCEQDNRLWGCSSANHEIYGSKLGDPKNWYCYAGLDSDSYAATVGTQNDFTGIISYYSTVYFFKEDGYHRLYGSKPSNFELSWKAGRGVQKGGEKSLAIVSEVLFFKSRDSICSYDGSTEQMSEALGVDPYYDAIGGGYRNKYYVGMRDADYNYRLYVYDLTKGTWCIEDSVRYKYMAAANGGFYIVNASNVLQCINREQIMVKWFPKSDIFPNSELYPGTSYSGTMEELIEWSLTTGDIGMNSPYYKYIKRFIVRLMLETSTYIKFEVAFDSSDDWETVMEYYCTKKRTYSIPVPVRRCDHMKFRISGHGEFRIYSIAKVTEDGDDGI